MTEKNYLPVVKKEDRRIEKETVVTDIFACLFPFLPIILFDSRLNFF